MKWIVLPLFVFSFCSFKAQFTELQQVLVELQQQVYQKDFSKKWIKTTKKNWEEKCNSSKTVTELNDLFNQFSDLFAQVTDFSMGNSDAKDEVELATYLLKVKSILKPEFITKWSPESQLIWENNLKAIIENDRLKKEQQRVKEEGEKQVQRLMYITNVTKDFEVNFKTVYEDSKKNSFKSVRAGEIVGSNKLSASNVNFNGASKSTIQLDDNSSLCLKLVYDCKGDAQLAEKVVSEITSSITKIVSSEYKKTNSMDTNFQNKNKFIFEFVGAKFSDTAKNPTITIGVEEATKNVVLIITEPVFGK